MLLRTLLLFALGTSLAVAAPTLTGPATAKVGAEVAVNVSGNPDPRDFVTIVPKGSQAGTYHAYEYAGKPGALKLIAPTTPGEYEIRLLGAQSPYPTLTSRPLLLESVAAGLEGPTQVAAGAKFELRWTGPNNERDYVGIGDADPKGRAYITYEYTRKGNPVSLTAPDQPGKYELRYFLGAGNKVVASRPITVGSVAASVAAPAEAAAGSTFAVNWSGPNNVHDYITIVAKGAHEGGSGNYAYTEKGNPASLLAPIAPGEYELRYATGQSHITLARTAVRITPGKEEPGLVAVTSATTMPAGSAVEIILDASGSMLQRIGSERRIDIAKRTLTKLTSTTLPAGTPFALRVFGRELDSCQTDLEIPVGPLDAATVGAKIARLEAKNNAKTPIGVSLDRVATDLQSVKGERLVILLTDGEETCGGDPAAAIEKLRKGGTPIRINIVGFAIDDAKLASTFRHWSALGSGMYFDAQDAAGLGAAMLQAMRPAFEIVNAQGRVIATGIAGGESVRVMPGDYTVRLTAQSSKLQAIVVKAQQTTAVKL